MYIGSLNCFSHMKSYLKSTDSDITHFGITLDSNDSERKLTDDITST